MQYISYYDSPMGEILLAADAMGLTGLWFEKQKYFAWHLDQEHSEQETALIKRAKEWLNVYFSGKEPDFKVPLHYEGTAFQHEVWDILKEIPYGKTVTYGEIAKQMADRRGIAKMSAQAVGGAVGHNEIAIIIPCHRVIGSNGNLTGYAGGIDKKIQLLQIEGAMQERYYIPKKGTAL
ncbi:MAG: methylated-DNA--[protein]-cysteine S-methyltransferase [Blautia sp.]|nr:methylated-DNA--[protein]-cysteine S-methyltransferase [Blautia sp.]